MATVQTVQGPIEGEDLGTVLIHEHVRFRDDAVARQWPVAYDREEELSEALEAVRAAAERGVRTICDATVMFGGRDVRFMHRVSQETDVQIVASTGIYTYDYLPHYFVNRDVDAMAELFVGDIERGVQGTDIKAAFLKCAADEPGLTEGVEKVHRAVARASNRTGAPETGPPGPITVPDTCAVGSTRNWKSTPDRSSPDPRTMAAPAPDSMCGRACRSGKSRRRSRRPPATPSSRARPACGSPS